VTGITAYFKNGGPLEKAAAMANDALDAHDPALRPAQRRGNARRGGAGGDLVIARVTGTDTLA